MTKKNAKQFVMDVMKLDEIVREGKTEKQSNCCGAGYDDERNICNECKEPCEIETVEIMIPIFQGRSNYAKCAADNEARISK